MAPSRIYVDLDDVLAETTQRFVSLAATSFRCAATYEELTVFDLRESLGLSDVDYTAFMRAAHADELLAELSPVPGALAAMEDWLAAGFELHVVTGRPPSTRGVSRAWLDRHGLGQVRLELVDKYARHPEERSLRSLDAIVAERWHLAVEDSPSVAARLASAGVPVALLERPWNRAAADVHALPNVRACRDWQAAQEVLRS